MNELIRGTVFAGLGKGASFTALDWASEQFVQKLGIEAHPGTLNIRLGDEHNLKKWQGLQATLPYSIDAPDRNSCNAWSCPVVINGRLAGAVVKPLLDSYDPGQVEIISPVNLRQALALRDGDEIELEFLHPVDAHAVIFDLDGTLLDSIEAFYILAKRTGDEFGVEMDQAHVYDLLNYGKPYWDAVLPATTPERQSTIKKMNTRAVQLWPEVMAEHARLFPAVRTTLDALRDRGFKLGIVTGSGVSSLEILYSAGVREHFDVVISNEDTSQRKPHPEGLLLCLARLGVAAEHAVYVGDTSIDMQASRAAGMSAVAVLSGAGNSLALCESGAHRIIQDHSGLVDILEKVDHVQTISGY